MIELVALDMAGTTIEEGGAVYQALHDAVVAEGVTVTEAQVQQWMGTDKRQALAALVRLGGGAPLSPDGVEAAYERFRTLLLDAYAATPPTPIPGVPEALRALRAGGVKVALTTGFAQDVVDPLLAGLGWAAGGDMIDAVVAASEVNGGRPAPYLIFRAMEKTGVHSVDRVLVAGDTYADLRAGVNAGVAMVVGVATGAMSLEDLGRERHTHLLPSVADLPALLNP
jgi:phosphonatase-like hydrolase